MIHLNEDDVRRNLPWPALIDAIEAAVADLNVAAPPRVNFEMSDPQLGEGHLLLMPAWLGADVIGIKTVTHWPGNVAHGAPSHSANYIVMDGRSGKVLAVLGATELTTRRTAAVSTLAARYLARSDARRLLVVGTGPVAGALVKAHATERDFERIEVYGRDADRAGAIVADAARDGIACGVSTCLESSVREADIVCTATSARSPVVHGAWLRPGTHVDLVGSFTPAMREVDDALLARADAIWVDTPTAAKESGDLCGPLSAGIIAPTHIRGDLRALLTRNSSKRDSPEAITVFKSVGFAAPDLAAARLALHNAGVDLLVDQGAAS